MGLVAPRKVRNFARDVAEVIGAEPEIEHLPPGLWRVTLTGDRVTASADFKASPSGVRYLSGALSIDGRPRRPSPRRNCGSSGTSTSATPA